jgi:hypothetical protein
LLFFIEKDINQKMNNLKKNETKIATSESGNFQLLNEISSNKKGLIGLKQSSGHSKQQQGNYFDTNPRGNSTKYSNSSVLVRSNERFDSTGMFHWTHPQSFESCVLNGGKKQNFTSHVIVCVYADKTSPLLGLRNFVLPLRASNYHLEELKPIIFIGNKEFLENGKF